MQSLYYILLIHHDLRVLLAGVRNLGTCPCVRCKTPKSRIHELGMKRDWSRRSAPTNIRIDDEHLRRKVNLARKWIYEQGKGVQSAAVEALLAEESLVPTLVRHF